MSVGVLSGCGDAGATIARLTVGAPGPDPYTVMLGSDRQQIAPSPQRGGERSGDQPGLYGGTRKVANCDPQGMVRFLQANPDKAKAWASVHKITPSAIPAFVARLTPVLLRVDTLVTNHGFREGRAVSSPAVLQAGMGVLVDQNGTPVVKCNCGNPLTGPDRKISTRNASYTGRSWPGFDARTVTKIVPPQGAKTTINVFVLVDVDGDVAFQRPSATDGDADSPPTPLPPTETPPPTGTPTGGPTDGTGTPTTPGTPTETGVPTEVPPTEVPPTTGVPAPTITQEEDRRGPIEPTVTETTTSETTSEPTVTETGTSMPPPETSDPEPGPGTEPGPTSLAPSVETRPEEPSAPVAPTPRTPVET
ncbi:DUF6777 domain-containing protein [Actinomadura kijaniata]|uniref:DUF6777 domain-containing protein n=1 Tax=Actinomadura kijaniata TaxID=46161 RepID=UPI0008370A4F|nr:DUF6777 domain-containing protein [Actinomadura kijaniata]